MPPLGPRLLLVVPICLYLLSLALPAVNVGILESGRSQTEYTDLQGYGVLLGGWISLIALKPAWLANLTFLTQLVVMWRGAKRLAIPLALAVATPALAISPLILPRSDGENYSLLIAYWVWLFALSINSIGLTVWVWARKPSKKQDLQ